MRNQTVSRSKIGKKNKYFDSVLQQVYKLLAVVILLSISSSIFAQNKEDYQWVFGYENGFTSTENQSSYIFDFEDETFNFIDLDSLPIEFHGSNSSVCDDDGKLLFYTNGCQVANRLHQVMPNGTDLNDGYLIDVIHDGECDGYRSGNSLTILQDPINTQGYYIIHKQIDIDSISGELFHNTVLYSYIDMSLDNGLGDVTIKNEPWIENTPLLSGYLTAIRHTNQKDWWIIQPMEESKGFITSILNEDGPQEIRKDTIEPFFSEIENAAGNAKFSPDGKKYAIFNQFQNLNIYDFDRLTGKLSNRLHFEVDHPDGLGVFGFLEFSPNSRFIYANTEDTIFQVDLATESEIDKIQPIGVWDGSNDPTPTAFFGTVLAPDCKIYIKSGSGSRRYHIIHSPNEKGEACDFEQGVLLPQISPLRTSPNFPRYRVDMEDNPCGDSYFSHTKEEDQNFEFLIIPNPAENSISISIDALNTTTVSISNSIGQIQYSDSSYQMNSQIEISEWQPGVYFVTITNGNASYSMPFIKQ